MHKNSTSCSSRRLTKMQELKLGKYFALIKWWQLFHFFLFFFFLFSLDLLCIKQTINIIFLPFLIKTRILTKLQQQKRDKTAPCPGTGGENNVKLIQHMHLVQLHVFVWVLTGGKVRVFIWGADAATFPWLTSKKLHIVIGKTQDGKGLFCHWLKMTFYPFYAA